MRDDDLIERPHYKPGGASGRGWLPGQSGNPHGRPKGARTIRERLVKMFGEDAHGLLEMLVQLSKSRNERVRLSAVQTMLSYHSGLPTAFDPVSHPEALTVHIMDASGALLPPRSPALLPSEIDVDGQDDA